ncbi:WD repeat domain phosphoinositide-interacting protein 4-like [Dysidea avara]|uniref:WD repeat domain phosphoinositide-interacting protein 4-like n=1 Tax=Dysidea avara TaxID=196820 RepID=UPI003318E128
MSQSRGVLNIRFNQDQGCFACGLESGFRIYNVHPLTEKTRQDFDEVGGVSHVEMLNRCNLLAIVGGGHSPKYPERNVMIWDDLKKKMICEITFHSPVLSVRLRVNKLIVVSWDEINVFKFPDPVEHYRTIQTQPNPKGLCEVTCGVQQLLLYPADHQVGKLQVYDIDSGTNTRRVSKVIDAHQNAIACIAVSRDGNKVATASTKGTLIRVSHIHGESKPVELRRGTDHATIQCINFSHDGSFLCVSSDKGTVHIFALGNLELNTKSKLAQVGLFGAYSESLWGLAQFTIPNESPCLCAFGSDNKSVVAVCMDGSFYRYLFTTEAGPSNNCIRDSFDIFLDIGNDGI